MSSTSSLDSSKSTSTLDNTAALGKVSGPPRRSKKAPTTLFSSDSPKDPPAPAPQASTPQGPHPVVSPSDANGVEVMSMPASAHSTLLSGDDTDPFGDASFSVPSKPVVPAPLPKASPRASPPKPATPVAAPSSSKACLFDGDEDIFGLPVTSAKPAAPPSSSPPLFGGKASSPPAATIKQPSPRPSKAASLFSDDGDTDLFGGGSTKDTKPPTAPSLPAKAASRGLFGDDDGDDIFSPKKATGGAGASQASKPAAPVKKASLFDDDDEGTDPFAAITAKKASAGSRKSKGLFDDDDPLFK